MSERAGFIAALMFFTRIPPPASYVYHESHDRKALKFAPLVGWVVGAVVALSFFVTTQVLPASVSLLIAIGAGVWFTGALHEDGLADFFDGMGGGHDAESTIRIMKDSRCGSYAVVGLIFALGLKFAVLWEIATHAQVLQAPWILGALFLGAHSVSRFCAISFAFAHERANPGSQRSTMGTRMTRADLTLACSFCLPPVAVLVGLVGLGAFLLVPVAWLVRTLLGKWFLSRLKGYTGDCLGAVQQLSEIAVYLSVLATLSFNVPG